MKKILFLFLIIITSCNTQKKVITENRCEKMFKNDYSTIVYDDFISIVNSDSIKINEVKYECVNNAMIIKKVMFDKFGKWDNELYSNNETRPNLIWNNVQLFENNDTKFMVIARGFESSYTIYASVMIFDNKQYDMLSETSEYRTKLVSLFSQLIKNNKSRKKEFYNVYLKIVDLEVREAYN